MWSNGPNNGKLEILPGIWVEIVFPLFCWLPRPTMRRFHTYFDEEEDITVVKAEAARRNVSVASLIETLVTNAIDRRREQRRAFGNE